MLCRSTGVALSLADSDLFRYYMKDAKYLTITITIKLNTPKSQRKFRYRMKHLERLSKQYTGTIQLFAQCAVEVVIGGKVLEAVIQNRNVGYLLGSFDIFGTSYFAHGGALHTQNEGNQRQPLLMPRMQLKYLSQLLMKPF